MAPTKKLNTGGHTINLEYVIRNHKGEDLKDGDKPITARFVIQECLANDDPRNPPSAADKLLSGMLLFKKLTEENPTFTAEELALMNKRCSGACTSVTWFQIERILDGKADPLCD